MAPVTQEDLVERAKRRGVIITMVPKGGAGLSSRGFSNKHNDKVMGKENRCNKSALGGVHPNQIHNTLLQKDRSHNILTPPTKGGHPNQNRNMSLQKSKSDKIECSNCGKHITKYYYKKHRETAACKNHSGLLTTAPSSSKLGENKVTIQPYPNKTAKLLVEKFDPDANSTFDNDENQNHDMQNHQVINHQQPSTSFAGLNISTMEEERVTCFVDPNQFNCLYESDNANNVAFQSCQDINQPSTSCTFTVSAQVHQEQHNIHADTIQPARPKKSHHHPISDGKVIEFIDLVDDDDNQDENPIHHNHREVDRSIMNGTITNDKPVPGPSNIKKHELKRKNISNSGHSDVNYIAEYSHRNETHNPPSSYFNPTVNVENDEKDGNPNIDHHANREACIQLGSTINGSKQDSNSTPGHSNFLEQDTYGRKRQKVSFDYNSDICNVAESASVPSPIDEQDSPMDCSAASPDDGVVSITEVNHTSDDIQQCGSESQEEIIEPQVIKRKKSEVRGENLPTMNWLSDVANSERAPKLGKSIEKICQQNFETLFDSLRLSYKGPARKQAWKKSETGSKKYKSYKSIIEKGTFGIYSDSSFLKRNVCNLYSLFNAVLREKKASFGGPVKPLKDLSYHPSDFSETVDFLNIFTKGITVPGRLMMCLVHRFAPVLQFIKNGLSNRNAHDGLADTDPLIETGKRTYKCGDRPQTSSSKTPCQCTFSDIMSRQCGNYHFYETLFSVVVTTAFVRIYARLYTLSKSNNCVLSTKEVQRIVNMSQLLESPIEFPDVDFAKCHEQLNKYLPREDSVQRLFTVARWYLVTALKIQEKANERKCGKDPGVSKATNVFANVKFEQNRSGDEKKSFPNSLTLFNLHLSSDDKDVRTLAALEAFRTTLDRNVLGFLREYILKTTCQLTEMFLYRKNDPAFDVLTEFEPLGLVFTDIYNNGESLERNLHNLNGYLFSTGYYPLSLDPGIKPTTEDFELYMENSKGH